jgi:hypothetical protein
VYRTACAQVFTVVAVAAVAGLAGCAAVQPGREAPAAAASASPVPAPALGTPTLAPIGPAGTPTTGPPAPHGTAPGQSAARKSLLTQADSGRTILLPVGAEVTVVLALPAPSMMMWDQPVVQGSAVTRVAVNGGYPSGLPARAVFLAVAPGTVQLVSQTDAQCNHQTPPCPAPDQAWQVTVLVPAS